jgi:hypothetical protein
MPWQRYVADVALEINPETNKLKYRTIVITVPRQSGKTTLLLSLMVHRAIGFGERQNIIYTAQTQKAARKKWEEEHVYRLEQSIFKSRYSLRFGMGLEQIRWANGSRHGLIPPNATAGHGDTVDLAVLDEAFSQEDSRVEQALRPAMITRPQPQLYIVSTAGDTRSLYLKDKVDRGRQYVEYGVDASIAYFEWSAPDDADPRDHETWYKCMPALGHTIDVDAIQSDFEIMQLAEFRRAYLNQWSDQIPELWMVVSEQDWDSAKDTASYIPDDRPLTFGIDFTPERTFGCITVAGLNQYDKLHVEITSDESRNLWDHRPGATWIVPRITELWEKWRSVSRVVAIQANSPAATLIPELQRKGIVVETPNAAEYAAACGRVFDSIYSGNLRHLGTSDYTASFAGVQKHDLGEGAWKWDRKTTTVDMSPVVSLTLAEWAHSKFAHIEPVKPWATWG